MARRTPVGQAAVATAAATRPPDEVGPTTQIAPKKKAPVPAVLETPIATRVEASPVLQAGSSRFALPASPVGPTDARQARVTDPAG